MDNEILDLLKSISNKLDNHKQILDEHTQLLTALEHASEIHKAEIDKVNFAIARVEGEVTKNWNDISKLKAVK